MKLLAALLAALLAVVTQTAVAQEKKITRQDLPPAVARAVDANSQGATIRGFSEEKEQGQTFYEVELTTHGHTKDLLIDSTGTVVEIEESVQLAELPAVVRQGLTAAAGHGTVTKVESITKRGKLVGYEAQITRDGKRSEVLVDPRGKPIKDQP